MLVLLILMVFLVYVKRFEPFLGEIPFSSSLSAKNQLKVGETEAFD